MKRIAVSIIGVACACVLFFSLGNTSTAKEYHEGFEYQKIFPALPTQAEKGKVEVIEVFWYGCPHCNDFEPYLQKWVEANANNIVFLRVPAQFDNSWKIHARAYYIAELFKKDHKFHQAMFDEIHKKDNFLDTKDKLQKFFAKHGVSKEQFEEAFDHVSVESKLKRAKELVEKKYNIKSVPYVVINGKYKTARNLAGTSYKDLIGVISYLVNKESAGSKTAADSKDDKKKATEAKTK